MYRVLALCLCLFVLLVWPLPVQAALPVNEGSLAPGGTAYEVNPDGQGGLWVTDYGAGEVWYVLPAETKFDYTAYLVGGSPSDARRSDDYFWWVDATSNLIGRAAVLDGAYSVWRIPSTVTFYGTVDDQGRLWATEWPLTIEPPDQVPHIIRFTVAANGSDAEACNFTLPDDGGSSYLAYSAGNLWIADEENSRILQLNVNTYAYTSWDLPDGKVPFGLAADPAGDLWFTDLSSISRLDPASTTKELSVYPEGQGASPQLVTVAEDDIWYSWKKGLIGGVGSFNPTAASSTSIDLDSTPGTLTPQCTSIKPEISDNLTMVSGSVGWTTGFYTELTPAEGWRSYEMPADADPWGIAVQDGKVYVVDQGRQKLVQIPLMEEGFSVFLPLIKR